MADRSKSPNLISDKGHEVDRKTTKTSMGAYEERMKQREQKPTKSPMRKHGSRQTLNTEDSSQPNKPKVAHTPGSKGPIRPKSSRKIASKSPAPTTKGPTPAEMTLAEIEAAQAMLLDPRFL